MREFKKKHQLLAASVVLLLVQGCATHNPKDLQNTPIPKPDSPPGLESLTFSPKEPVLIDLSKDSAGQFKSDTVLEMPQWITSAKENPSTMAWTLFKVHPGSSLKSFFSREGLSVSWMDNLKRSDYFKLATTYYDQQFYASHDANGEVSAVFTKSKNGMWYYVESMNNHAFFSYFGSNKKRSSSVYLTPDSRVDSLNHDQLEAIRLFLSRVDSNKNNAFLIALSKGNVKLFYSQLYLDQKPTGYIDVVKVEISHEGKEFTYIVN